MLHLRIHIYMISDKYFSDGIFNISNYHLITLSWANIKTYLCLSNTFFELD